MSDPTCPFTVEDIELPGSRWLLANFHTHSPGSFDYASELLPNSRRSSKDIAKAILDDCLQEGVHILAVTDHNSPSFVRTDLSSGKSIADPESESYYAMMRALVKEEPERYSRILVLPGVEIGAENIHVLGFFPPSDDPGWDVLRIAAILDEGNCPPEFYGDHQKSCTDFSIADAIDVIHERGGIAIPAHIDGASGFLKEESQSRLLKLIVSRPHLFAVEYLRDATRAKLEKLISAKRVLDAREGQSIAWTQSSDAHFVRVFDPGQGGNGVPIGTVGRRTWLRLDPDALTFEAVRAALMDPENRVRVDKTSRPLGRQGEYRPLPSDRTYVRALRIDWGRNRKEVLRFNKGINAIVGPPKAGKTARAQTFSIIGGTSRELSTDIPPAGSSGRDEASPKLKSVDIILERGVDTEAWSMWWLHRESDTEIYVARIEMHGNGFRAVPGTNGDWVGLYPNDQFDRRALREYFKNLPLDQSPSPLAIPQAFNLDSMKEMLDDPTRIARFIEWHYVPEALMAHHRQIHAELRRLTLDPGSMSATDLSAEFDRLFNGLKTSRRRAVAVLGKLYKDRKVGLDITWTRGKWTSAQSRKQVAEEILGMPSRDPKSVFDVLKSIEDRAQVLLRLAGRERKYVTDPKEQINIALRGLLLVIGARDLGPVVLDAPGAYFEPAELVETLAPILLNARDDGAQLVMSIDDTNLPFAVDTDLLLVCKRDQRKNRIGPLDEEATGGLEKSATARWALTNLDGGGGQFARRMQVYAEVLGENLAERQKKLSQVVIALGKSSSRSAPRGR